MMKKIIKAFVHGADILERQPTHYNCKMPTYTNKVMQSMMIQGSLNEAKKVSKLGPFPEDWVWETTEGQERQWPAENYKIL